ncbi:GntR family transcriptional regulator [soil metagenome]
MERSDRPTKQTAADRAYLAIRSAIIDGTLLINSRLTEEALAEHIGVSRTPVRAALQRLNNDGFVEFSPHLGAVVKGWSAADVREMFEVRAMLEGMGCYLAADRATAEDVARLTDLCEEMEETAASAKPQPRVSELNRRLHLELLRIGGNRRLQDIAGNLMDLGFLVRSFSQFTHSDVERSLSHHREIVAALRAGNSRWAEAIMRAHILTASEIFTGT